MQHITRTKATQIGVLIKDGADMAEVATQYRVTIERIEALTGVSRKDNKKQAKALAKATESAIDPADDFSEE